jgi:adhesin/invasin
MRTGTRRYAPIGLTLALAALVTVACDKVPLTAPASSSITVSAPTRTLPTGGSTQVSAEVIEQGGTPVQNGTTVRFTTNLGRVDPPEVQTRNGVATTTFFAGDVSGAAEVKATSGGASTTTGSTTSTSTNAVTILVGSAAVDSVTVRSSAGSVPATGGTVDIIATVLSTGGASGTTAIAGGPMPGVSVTFSTTAGTLSGTREVTDGNGEARTRLTTDANATVTATAGTKSGTVAIQALNPVAQPTITLASAESTANSAGQLFTFTATVANNAALGSPIKFEWNFGDGATADTNGPATGHVFTQELTVYNITVTAVFANGTRVSALTQIVTDDFP